MYKFSSNGLQIDLLLPTKLKGSHMRVAIWKIYGKCTSSSNMLQGDTLTYLQGHILLKKLMYHT